MSEEVKNDTADAHVEMHYVEASYLLNGDAPQRGLRCLTCSCGARGIGKTWEEAGRKHDEAHVESRAPERAANRCGRTLYTDTQGGIRLLCGDCTLRAVERERDDLEARASTLTSLNQTLRRHAARYRARLRSKRAHRATTPKRRQWHSSLCGQTTPASLTDDYPGETDPCTLCSDPLCVATLELAEVDLCPNCDHPHAGLYTSPHPVYVTHCGCYYENPTARHTHARDQLLVAAARAGALQDFVEKLNTVLPEELEKAIRARFKVSG